MAERDPEKAALSAIRRIGKCEFRRSSQLLTAGLNFPGSKSSLAAEKHACLTFRGPRVGPSNQRFSGLPIAVPIKRCNASLSASKGMTGTAPALSSVLGHSLRHSRSNERRSVHHLTISIIFPPWSSQFTASQAGKTGNSEDSGCWFRKYGAGFQRDSMRGGCWFGARELSTTSRAGFGSLEYWSPDACLNTPVMNARIRARVFRDNFLRAARLRPQRNLSPHFFNPMKFGVFTSDYCRHGDDARDDAPDIALQVRSSCPENTNVSPNSLTASPFSCFRASISSP